jgi:hypothetical protein
MKVRFAILVAVVLSAGSMCHAQDIPRSLQSEFSFTPAGTKTPGHLS